MTMNYEVYRKKYALKDAGIRDYFSLSLVTNGSFAVHVWDEAQAGESNLDQYTALPYSCIEPIITSKPSPETALIYNTGEFLVNGVLGIMSYKHAPVSFFRTQDEKILIGGGQITGSQGIIIPFSDFVDALGKLEYLRLGTYCDGGFYDRLYEIEKGLEAEP